MQLIHNYRGTTRRRVTDQQGAAIAGAKLTLIDQGTNETRATITRSRSSALVLTGWKSSNKASQSSELWFAG